MAKVSGEWIGNVFTSDITVGDGVEDEFTLVDDLQSVNSLDVYVDGLRRRITTDYTVNLGTSTITFVSPPATAQVIQFTYIKKG